MINFTSDSTAEGQYGSLAETTYVLVRQKIESGELGPSTVLKEAEISAALSMGRTPVREALQRLRSEGLLVHSSKGYVVLELSVKDILNVFQVRSMLEAAAARQAARAKTRVDLARMLDALEDEKAALEGGDPLLAAKLAENFYESLVAASRNRFLEGNLRSVRLLTVPYLKRIAKVEGMAQRCYEERIRIYEAVDSRDYEGAEDAIRFHMRQLMWAVVRVVEEESPALRDPVIRRPPEHFGFPAENERD
jgi:DNA-binding GntR family transcriptional regulator